MTEPRIAILDVDGTLYPGSLGVDLLSALVAADACDRHAAQRVVQVLGEHQAGAVDFRTMARRAYAAFALALADRRVDVVEAIAREVWSDARPRLFEFVPELLACLHECGFEPMLISGSPIEMIGLVAGELGIGRAHGAVFTRAGGRYTGQLELGAGLPGEKLRIFARQNAHAPRPRRLAHGFAIGNGLTDAVLFERVALPLAFEPDPELTELAAARGWIVVSRDDVVRRVRALLGEPVSRTSPVLAPEGELPC